VPVTDPPFQYPYVLPSTARSAAPPLAVESCLAGFFNAKLNNATGVGGKLLLLLGTDVIVGNNEGNKGFSDGAAEGTRLLVGDGVLGTVVGDNGVTVGDSEGDTGFFDGAEVVLIGDGVLGTVVGDNDLFGDDVALKNVVRPYVEGYQ